MATAKFELRVKHPRPVSLLHSPSSLVFFTRSFLTIPHYEGLKKIIECEQACFVFTSRRRRRNVATTQTQFQSDVIVLNCMFIDCTLDVQNHISNAK